MHLDAQLWLYVVIGLAIFVPVLWIHRRANLARVRQAVADSGGRFLEARLVTPPPGRFANPPLGCYYEVRYADPAGVERTEHCYFTHMGELRWMRE